MEIRDEDLEIVIGCVAAHPNQRGGQHVARACTAVLVIHKPTGLAARCSEHRSQLSNKQEALRRLRGILAYEDAHSNAFEAWPADQPARYNACTDPCDMWTGPCACGAWHREGK